MLFFIILSYIFGFYAFLALIVGIFLFLPNPLPPAPIEYAVTRYGIIIGKKEMKLFNNRNIIYKLNEKDNSISAVHRRKGEILKLYTPEPEYLYDLILSLKKGEYNTNAHDLSASIDEQDTSQESEQPHKTRVYNESWNVLYIKIKTALSGNPPIVLLVIASILAFFGLVTGDMTISVTAQTVFNLGLLFWVIWYIYKKISKTKNPGY